MCFLPANPYSLWTCFNKPPLARFWPDSARTYTGPFVDANPLRRAFIQFVFNAFYWFQYCHVLMSQNWSDSARIGPERASSFGHGWACMLCLELFVIDVFGGFQYCYMCSVLARFMQNRASWMSLGVYWCESVGRLWRPVSNHMRGIQY